MEALVYLMSSNVTLYRVLLRMDVAGSLYSHDAFAWFVFTFPISYDFNNISKEVLNSSTSVVCALCFGSSRSCFWQVTYLPCWRAILSCSSFLPVYCCRMDLFQHCYLITLLSLFVADVTLRLHAGSFNCRNYIQDPELLQQTFFYHSK